MADNGSLEQWKKEVLGSIDRDEIVRIACDLVNISSPTGYEAECADYILGRYKQNGIKNIPQEFDEGRRNAIGVIKGDGSGPCLMFNGHMDTSYIGNEDYLPDRPGYKPHAIVEDGWIYGLGIYNMKGGLAAFLHAAEVVKRSGVPLKGDILLACVGGEIEKSQVADRQGRLYRGGGCGTWYAITHGAVADFAVVGEPTGLSLMQAHGGYVWTRITLVGNPRHTVFGQVRNNTINNMIKLANHLQAWGDEFERRNTYQGMTSKVTLSAIEGGWPHRCSRVPVYCTLYVDTRLMPGQSPLIVQREMEEAVAQLQRNDPDFASLHLDMNIFMNQWGSECSPEQRIYQEVLQAHQEVAGSPPDITAVSFASDACELVGHGIPALNYGPTGKTRTLSDGRHYGKAQSDWNPDVGEHASIDDMVQGARTYATLILNLCTRTRDELGIERKEPHAGERHKH
ncbi:MAG TPA: M20/M25/M40 family metallo-hydrolase [Casimicrobiaceae bacterium]|nr:M20/M25/M40 family metallo-hydrolase [Casimicrobiaceae bacterium]